MKETRGKGRGQNGIPDRLNLAMGRYTIDYRSIQKTCVSFAEPNNFQIAGLAKIMLDAGNGKLQSSYTELAGIRMAKTMLEEKIRKLKDKHESVTVVN
jgi:hypothetical protein